MSNQASQYPTEIKSQSRDAIAEPETRLLGYQTTSGVGRNFLNFATTATCPGYRNPGESNQHRSTGWPEISTRRKECETLRKRAPSRRVAWRTSLPSGFAI